MNKKNPKQSQLIIDRKKWYRGKGCDESQLYKSSGKMCCLGFACKQLGGLKTCHINGINTPQAVADRLDAKSRAALLDTPLSFLFTPYVHDVVDVVNSNECNNLMNINDNMECLDVDRESLIKKIFKQNHIKVKFIN